MLEVMVMRINLFSIENNQRGRYQNKIEHGLKKFVVMIFLLLIFIQIIMLNDSVRSFLVSDYELEGRPLAVNEMLFNEGKLRLQLVAPIPDQNITVRVNGEQVAAFQTNIVEVKVKDGDVLGINSNGSTQKGEIEIVSKTPNIQNNCVGKRFRTDGDPKGTLRLKVTNNGK